jgi:hypothetical protein
MVLCLVVAVLHYMFRPTWPSSSVYDVYLLNRAWICHNSVPIKTSVTKLTINFSYLIYYLRYLITKLLALHHLVVCCLTNSNGFLTRFLLLSYSCGFVYVGSPLWLVIVVHFHFLFPSLCGLSMFKTLYSVLNTCHFLKSSKSLHVSAWIVNNFF